MRLNPIHKLFGKDNILQINCIFEQGSYLLIPETRNPAADFRHKKLVLLMLMGKLNELVNIRLDGLAARRLVP